MLGLRRGVPAWTPENFRKILNGRKKQSFPLSRSPGDRAPISQFVPSGWIFSLSFQCRRARTWFPTSPPYLYHNSEHFLRVRPSLVASTKIYMWGEASKFSKSCQFCTLPSIFCSYRRFQKFLKCCEKGPCVTWQNDASRSGPFSQHFKNFWNRL